MSALHHERDLDRAATLVIALNARARSRRDIAKATIQHFDGAGVSLRNAAIAVVPGRPWRTIGSVARQAFRVGPVDACFRGCIAAAWQPLPVAPVLPPRSAMRVRRRLFPSIQAGLARAGSPGRG